MELALWLHDVVYDPQATDNEAQSARWAAEVLQRTSIPAMFAQRVTELILATDHTALSTESDTQYLVDIDLSILGQPNAVFDDYERKIRQEYQWVPVDAYRIGRTHILQQFLNRNKIYQTPHFQNRYEATARQNLRRSIAKLQSHTT